MAVMNLNGTNFTRLTDWNGSGHGIVNSEGNEIVCSLSDVGLPEVLQLEGSNTITIGLPLPIDATAGASFENRYNEVAKIHWSYPAWGNDDHSLFLNGQGSSADNVISFSRLLYVSFNDQWKSPDVFNFSSAIENLAGKSGRDFCTALFRPIPTDSGKVYVCVFDLINLYESGSVSKDKILTLSISSDQYRLNDDYIDYYENYIIRPLLDLQNAGKIQLVTFEELITIWKTQFDSVAHVYNAPDQTSIRKNKNTNFYFNLNQNYPNPFNSSTAISYQLSGVSFVEYL